jgi:hypothetical protein
VPSPANARQVLRTLAGIEDIQTNGVYVQVSGVSSEAVVVHLTSHGILPAEVITQRSDLEALFLTLTRK